MNAYKGDFISGQFIPVRKGHGEFKDISPGDLQDVIMTVPFSHDHIDLAVESARKAFRPWAHLKLDERKRYLLRLKEVFESQNGAMMLKLDLPSWVDRLVALPIVLHGDIVDHELVVQVDGHFITDH